MSNDYYLSMAGVKGKKRRRKTKPDNKAQSERSIEAAKALGVDESGESFEKAISMVVGPSQKGQSWSEPAMDERAKFKSAYDAWVKSRKTFDSWMRDVINGKAVADIAEGLRLAADCQSALQNFMSAAKPFVYSRK